ncbi:hypothetical protein EDD21DRAFT_437402 [Dissophora ornata]|nr:hypothetical protein EDD21DRAFT_437402 [Dissophora ornata]
MSEMRLTPVMAIVTAVPPAVSSIAIPRASAWSTSVLFPAVTEQSELWMKDTVQGCIQPKLLPHSWRGHDTPDDGIDEEAFLGIATKVADVIFGTVSPTTQFMVLNFSGVEARWSKRQSLAGNVWSDAGA